jgi:hypothetical protein
MRIDPGQLFFSFSTGLVDVVDREGHAVHADLVRSGGLRLDRAEADVLEDLKTTLAVWRLAHGDLGVVAVEADGCVGPLSTDRVTAEDVGHFAVDLASGRPAYDRARDLDRRRHGATQARARTRRPRRVGAAGGGFVATLLPPRPVEVVPPRSTVARSPDRGCTGLHRRRSPHPNRDLRVSPVRVIGHHPIGLVRPIHGSCPSERPRFSRLLGRVAPAGHPPREPR